MDIYAIKFWKNDFIVAYKLDRWDGELKWIVDGNLENRDYIFLGKTGENHQWIIPFEESHLKLEIMRSF